MHCAIGYALAVVSLLGLPLVFSFPILENAPSRLSIAWAIPLGREQKSWLDDKFDVMKHLVRRPATASHFWACDDDADLAWCPADELPLFRAPSNADVGLRFAFIIFASSFIVTAMCAFL